MTCKPCARSIRGLGEGPRDGCRGCDARGIARASEMLTAMDPSRPRSEREAAGERMAEQLHTRAKKHGITYQQAKKEALEWFQIDQLNRGEVPQE